MLSQILCNLRYAYFNTPGKGGKLVFVFPNFVQNIEKCPSYRIKKEQCYSTCYFADIPWLCMQSKWFVLGHVIYVLCFFLIVGDRTLT